MNSSTQIALEQDSDSNNASAYFDNLHMEEMKKFQTLMKHNIVVKSSNQSMNNTRREQLQTI